MKLFWSGLVLLAVMGLTSCGVSAQDAVVPVVVSVGASSPQTAGSSPGADGIDPLAPACPNGGEQTFTHLVTALVRVNEGQTDKELVRHNTENFVNNLSQMCGTQYSAQQRSVLIRELMALTAG